MKNRIVPVCIIVTAFLLVTAIPRISSAQTVTIDPSTASYWVEDYQGTAPSLWIESSGVAYFAPSATGYAIINTAGTVRAWYATLLLAETRGKTVQITYAYDGVNNLIYRVVPLK